MNLVTAAVLTVASPYDHIELPPFPSIFTALTSQLSHLAGEHSQHTYQKIPVVGIGGCPGVGKTTLTNLLAQKLKSEGVSFVIVRFDDWTNPEDQRENGYFNLEGVHAFFAAFSEGQQFIEKPVVNEFTGEYSRETLDLRNVDLILFEGLLALSAKEPTMNYSRYCDESVFIEADETDISKWKRERPTNVQRTDEEFEAHMKGVLDYHHENIEPFKANAHWIIQKDSNHGYRLFFQL